MNTEPRTDSGEEPNIFIAPRIGGRFTIAAYYNIAAEESKMVSAFLNNAYSEGEGTRAGYGRYTAFWGQEVHPHDKEVLRVAAPHAGNTIGNESAVGYEVLAGHFSGNPEEAAIYLYGFNKIDFTAPYATAAVGPHLVVDVTRYSTAFVTLDGLFCHGDRDKDGTGTRPKVCVKVKAVSPNIECFNLAIVNTRQIKSRNLGFDLGPTTYLHCRFEWPDLEHLWCQDGARFSNCLISNSHPQGVQIRLPDTPLETDRVEHKTAAFSGEIITSDLEQVSVPPPPRINMGGAILRTPGRLWRLDPGRFPDPTRNPPPILSEERRFGNAGLTYHTYDGLLVRGKKGPDLGDGDRTLRVAEGQWYYLPAGTLGGDREVQLSAEGAEPGNIVTIARADTSTHALRIMDDRDEVARLGGEGSLISVRFDGARWTLHERSRI